MVIIQIFGEMRDNEDDFKKRRQEFVINIRRSTREELLNKRRNLEEFKVSEEEEQQKFVIDERYHDEIQEMINAEYNESMFDQLITNLNSTDPLFRHRGIIGFRKILSKDVNPPINKFIDRGLLNTCIQFVKQKQFPHLKLEATWILTNIAAGEKQHCQKIVEKGVVDLLINLLVENERGIVDQAIWGIGNVAADDIKYRDQILKKGGMDALIKVINTTLNKNIIRNGVWAITNLCRGFPAANMKLIKDACQLLCKTLKSGTINLKYKDILSDAIWAISHITESNKSKIQTVNREGILNQIFQYSLSQYPNIQIPSIKLIGNFSGGNENHTDALINCGIFNLALNILSNPRKSIRRQICWILSNIAAGVAKQVEAFLERKDLLDKLGFMFHHDQVDVKIEICWIYPNFGHLGNRHKSIQICIDYDVITVYTKLLEETNPTFLINVLDTLEKLMAIGRKCEVDGKNIIIQKFLVAGGGNKLEQLQMHPDKKVYERALKILTKFFQLENENAFQCQ